MNNGWQKKVGNLDETIKEYTFKAYKFLKIFGKLFVRMAKSRFRWAIVVGLGFTIFLLYIYAYPFLGSSSFYNEIKPGDIAKRDYYNDSNEEISYIDHARTQQRNERLAQSLPPAMIFDPDVQSKAINKINQFEICVDKIRKQINDRQNRILDGENNPGNNNTQPGDRTSYDDYLVQSVNSLNECLNETIGIKMNNETGKSLLNVHIADKNMLFDGLRELARYIYGEDLGVYIEQSGNLINTDEDYFEINIDPQSSNQNADIPNFRLDRIISHLDPDYESILQENFERVYQNPGQEIKAIIREILERDLLLNIPNLKNDQERWQEIYNQETSKPLTSVIKAGEMIISKGYSFSQSQAIRVNALLEAQSQRETNSIAVLGLVVFLILTLAVFMYYLGSFQRDRITQYSYTPLIYIIFIGINLFFLHFVLNLNINVDRLPAGLFIPTGMTAMVLSILLCHTLALSAVALITILYIVLSAVTGNFVGPADFISPFIVLFSGLIGVFATMKIKKRGDLFSGALFIFIANAVLCLVYIMLMDYNETSDLYDALLKGFAWSLLNGLSAAMLTLGILPTLESAFNIPTTFRLLELADLNTPLLKELLINAPGTFQHSILVAMLAESAANDIGANGLLARVGAYYHDIGKMVNPEYFIENQTKENLHTKLKPSLSAAIIKSHVKKGIEIGQRHKLPSAILDFIAQHHGTSLIQFFYKQAQDRRANGEIINPENYQYPGPRPRTKETAIVMLADIVEATTRAQGGDILSSAAANKIISNTTLRRLLVGELSDSPLCLDELKKVSDSFYTVIMGAYHKRVAYPDKVEKDTEGSKADQTKEVKESEDDTKMKVDFRINEYYEQEISEEQYKSIFSPGKSTQRMAKGSK